MSGRGSDSLHPPFSRGQSAPARSTKAQSALCAPGLGRAGSCALPCALGSAENETRGLKLRFKN